MTSLRVGVIGIGGIAEVAHLPGYRQAGARVLAIATSRPDEVRDVVDAFEVAHVHTDHRELLSRDDIDAVSVCVPTYRHEPIVVDALRAGKHVLCEKPPGLSGAEAERMHQAAGAANRLLCYALSARFGSAAKKMRQFVDAGRFGEIYAARSGWMRRRGNPAGWFTRRAHAGGGALIDLGIHGLDLAWWLMGCPRPVAATGATYREFGHYASDDAMTPDPVMQRHLARQPKVDFDVEDAGFAFVRFDTGAHLMLEASWALNTREERRYVTLYGTRSGADVLPQSAQLYSELDGTLVDVAPHIPPVNGYMEQLRHFVKAVQGDEEPIAPSHQGVTLMRMIDAIYASALSRREVVIA
jgi:predicted dehydrogenase